MAYTNCNCELHCLHGCIHDGCTVAWRYKTMRHPPHHKRCAGVLSRSYCTFYLLAIAAQTHSDSTQEHGSVPVCSTLAPAIICCLFHIDTTRHGMGSIRRQNNGISFGFGKLFYTYMKEACVLICWCFGCDSSLMRAHINRTHITHNITNMPLRCNIKEQCAGTSLWWASHHSLHTCTHSVALHKPMMINKPSRLGLRQAHNTTMQPRIHAAMSKWQILNQMLQNNTRQIIMTFSPLPNEVNDETKRKKTRKTENHRLAENRTDATI